MFLFRAWVFSSILSLSIGFHFFPCKDLSKIRSADIRTKIQLKNSVEQPQATILPTFEKEYEELIDEAINDLFQQQINEGHLFDKKGLNYQEFKKRNKIRPITTTSEPTIALLPEIPLAFIWKNKLHFGNFVSPKGPSSAITVRTVSEQALTIDISQVVEIWDDIADEQPPIDAQSWATVITDAIRVIRMMSPRKSNLEEFWTLLREMNYLLAVDSLDLSVYIFQERKFFAWMQPSFTISSHENRPEDADDEGEIEEELSSQLKVPRFSAAQRYAALILLFNDPFHFKRKLSLLSYPEEMVDDSAAYELDDVTGEVKYNRRKLQLEVDPELKPILTTPTAAYVKVGGFQILEESICLYKEAEVFYQYYLKKTNTQQPQEEKEEEQTKREKGKDREDLLTQSLYHRILRSLEMYALTRDQKSPPRLLKMILKRCSFPVSSTGAQSLLLTLGYSLSAQSNLPYAVRLQPFQEKKNNRGEGNSSSESETKQYYIQNLTPWSPEIFDAIAQLRQQVLDRQEKLLATAPGKIGKTNLFGRMDYRSNEQHPPFCIDANDASFYDDAFSLSPSTGEILIHIADVRERLLTSEALQQIAKERLATTFLPSGPLHMFPPAALDLLKLSKDRPNEVLTVAIKLHPRTGEILRYRVFPAVIGPVYPLEMSQANEILDLIGIVEKKTPTGETIVYESVSHRYPTTVVNDLLFLQEVVQKMIQRDPWLDLRPSSSSSSKRKKTKKQSKEEEEGHSPAHRIINSLLTLYANASYDFCLNSAKLAVPLAWENRDQWNPAWPRRFATQPLRNWVSLLQQQQVRAALRLDLPLTRDQCALAVSYYQQQRKSWSKLVNQHKQSHDFQRLVQDYQQQQQQQSQSEEDHKRWMLVEAEGLGKGGLVRLYPYNLNAMADQTVDSGELVKVRIEKLVPETKTILVHVV